MKWGGDRSKGSKDLMLSRTNNKAAKMLDVSHTAVKRVRAVRSSGAPELVKAVERDEVSLSAAVSYSA